MHLPNDAITTSYQETNQVDWQFDYGLLLSPIYQIL